MENPFDQFDATRAAASSNPFDQFDAKGPDTVPNPFDDHKDEPGALSRVGSAIAGGARTGLQDLLTSGRQNTAAVTGDKVEAAPPDTDPRAAPIDWFSLPSLSGIEKGAYQATKGLVSGAPEMAWANAGAGLGTAAVGGPEDPLAALAAPVGAALGAGGVSALRSFYPLYAEEKAKGLGDDEAWAAAKSRAIRDGLVTGAAFGLFEARPVFGAVKGLLSDTYSQATTAAAKKAAMDQAVQSTAVNPVRNVAEQALVVQPGAAAAGQVANNAVEGKPLGENVANAAGSAAIGTVIPMGAHLAGSAAIGKAKDAPAAEAPTRPGPGRGAADQAVGVAGAPSEKIAAVLNSNPAVEIEKAAERGKEVAQEAAPPAEPPVEPAATPTETAPSEPTPAEEPAPEAPPATPAEAVADASQHGTEEAQALLSPAFTEHKIRDTTGAAPEPRPAERAEPWKRPEPGETTAVTLPGTREPVEATVHGYQGEGPGERVILELPDGTVRNPLTSGVSFTEHVIRNVTDQAMGLNRAERAAPWVPPAPPVPEPRFTEHQIRDVTGEPPAARPAERAEPWQPPAKPEAKPADAAEPPKPAAEEPEPAAPEAKAPEPAPPSDDAREARQREVDAKVADMRSRADALEAQASKIDGTLNRDYNYLTQPIHHTNAGRSLAKKREKDRDEFVRVMQMRNDATGLRTQADALEKRGAVMQGDAEKAIQDRRDAVDVRPGDTVQTTFYGPRKVLKVNKKTLIVEAGNPEGLKVDKSHIERVVSRADDAAHSLPGADRPPSLADDAVRARVASVLRDRLKALGLDDQIGLKVEHALDAVVNGETVSPNGRYFQKVIEVAMDAEGGVSRAFDHEVLHGLKDLGVFTDGEWNALSRIAESKWIKQYGIDTKPGYKELPKSKQVEEAIAHAFSDSEAVKYGGLIGRAIRNGRNLIEAIGNAMRGNGFTSARGLFDRVRAGDLAERAESLRDNSGDPVPVPDNSLRDRILRNPLVKRAANADVAKSGAEYTKGMLDDLTMKVTPMAVGSDRARAAAKDFANDMRAVQDKYGQIDRMLTEHYTPAERSLMGSAIDEQSVMEQTGNVEKGKGLDRLTPDQRATATMLNDLSKKVWQGLYDAGIVTSPDGLPSYMPRMFVSVGDDGSVERLKGDGPGAGAINAIGRNLSTSGPQKRNHLTAAESEAAAKAKFGDNTTLVTDIRALPLALARSERAISGRKLVDAIKKIGDQVGEETTADGEKPGFFTIDHPALKTYSREKVGDEWALTKKPLYISQEFEGPLRAVLTQKSGNLYNALMAFKGGATGLIMYSPLIHNMVEWGRALPLLPGKVITGKVYFEGNRAKNDPALRAQAVGDGLVPIGRGNHTDITSIAADPQLQPGRSMTAKAIGAGAEAIGLGKDAADGIRRSIDKAGEFWHGTLLWDRVADLQFGIYKNMRDKLTGDGMDAQTAGRVAAHLANRYAGALPAEAASNAARKLANLTFFSRSFTFGNVGVLKDVLNGMPLDVRAQIARDAGVLNSTAAQKVARSAARHAFLLDLGMFYAGNALLQSGMSVLHGDSSLDDEAKGYVSRFVKALGRVSSNPLEALNPFGFLQSLTPNSENEPNKENRIRTPYRNDDGSAIYVRNPVGKVGEEFAGLITNLPEWFKRKESTLLRPVMEILNNDAGFGRKVYDTSDPTVSSYFKAAGNIVGHFMGSQVPLPSIESVGSMLTGTAHSADVLKAVGPLVGVGFSKGTPGGPQVGMMFAEQDRARAAVARAMPDVNKLIDAGRTDDAVQKMLDAGMSVSEIRGHLKYRQAPEARINANSMTRFERTATPEEKEKMDRFLQQRP